MNNMALKLTLYLYLLMERPVDPFIKVQPPCYQAAKCNQKTILFLYPQRDRKSKKRISINIKYNYHQCSSPWVTLMIHIEFQPNQQKWYKTVCCNKILSPLGVLLTPLECWPIKAREASVSNEVRFRLHRDVWQKGTVISF